MPGRAWSLGVFLDFCPWPSILGLYMFASHARAVKNPDDKLMPSLHQMYIEMKTIITVPDKRSGKNLSGRTPRRV